MSTEIQQAIIVRRAIIVLLAGAAAIAFAPIFVRLSELGPIVTGFYRMAFALPVLWFWMVQEKKSDQVYRSPSSVKDFARLSLAGLFFVGDLSFWHWSIELTSIANSTLLANFAPIFVTLGGFLLFGERFSRTFLIGMFFAILGVLLLLGDSFAFKSDHLLGDAYGLVAAVFYAAYIMAVGRLRSEFSTATVMAWSGLVTAIGLIPISIISGDSFVAQSVFGWAVLAGLAIISHAGGQSMVAYALAHLPAAFGSVGLLLQPALAAILAWFIFDESLSPLQMSGGLVVILGIYFARRGTR